MNITIVFQMVFIIVTLILCVMIGIILLKNLLRLREYGDFMLVADTSKATVKVKGKKKTWILPYGFQYLTSHPHQDGIFYDSSNDLRISIETKEGCSNVGIRILEGSVILEHNVVFGRKSSGDRNVKINGKEHVNRTYSLEAGDSLITEENVVFTILPIKK